MTDKPFRIGLAGLGTVGVGVVKILQENADMIAARAGRAIEIVAVSARSKDKDRGVNLSNYEWVDDPANMATEDVDAVVEVIGGSDGPVKDLVEAALQNKKHVVTANKALLAHHGLVLAKLAEDNGASLNYEAAVAGGIPVIKELREGLAANHIHSVYGILNGTCNYILTEMRETGRNFEDVLKEAQDKGYAEADPSFDIDGIDTAHKLALLTALAFGVQPDFDNLPAEGIAEITAQDIQFAGELGYRIKLLGVARRLNGHLTQSVEPCLVKTESTLGAVEGVFNAVFIDGDFVDKGMMTGRGAGERPTASSVVADIIDLARGVRHPTFGIPVGELSKPSWAEPEEVINRYYLHLKVQDQPGVIADVTAVFKAHDVSIEAFLQHGRAPDQPVSVVIVTHETSQKAMQDVIEKVEKIEAVTKTPTFLRIEDIERAA